MGKIIREDCYFDKPGQENTDHVVDAVVSRVESSGVKHVVVASSSGLTGVKFGRALKGRAKVICISPPPLRRALYSRNWPSIEANNREELAQLGVTLVEHTSYVFEGTIVERAKFSAFSPEFLVRQTLYCFGHGFKVAIEVVLIAVDLGFLEPYQEVIGVGGADKGADTAVVVRGTYPSQIFGGVNHGLEIREIIAMPRTKTQHASGPKP